MKNLLVLILLFILSSCGSGFVRKARSKSNTAEITGFKKYLDSINISRDFKEENIITYSEADSVMQAFFKKYKIRSLRVSPCKSCKYSPGSYGCIASFKNCGHIIILEYANFPIWGNYHRIYFDYSEEGLQLKEGWSKRSKIADRIFVF